MKVFLSWSGDASKEVAAALDVWLPLIFPDVSLWLSTRNIEAGQRWDNQLDEQLEATTFGILCLVPTNLLSPWLLFEAGALSKTVETSRVVPYCLGISADEIQGPLSRFQGVAADKNGTRRLVESINAQLANPRPEAVLSKLFDRLWPDLEQSLAQVPAVEARGPSTVKVHKILCAATKEFAKLGASEDMDVIDASYPNTVTRLNDMRLEQLRTALTSDRYEIVHLLGYVDPKTGDLLFDDSERLSAGGLLKLIELGGTQLLFLASCDSLTLGAILSRSVSVIAASDSVEAAAMIRWERCFYELLSKGKTLTTSYDIAQATTNLPMRLLFRNDAVLIPT